MVGSDCELALGVVLGLNTALGRNVTVGSTAARECDHALYIRVGPEIVVAATNTFASQLAALNLLVLATAGSPARDVVSALRDLPGDGQSLLDDSTDEAVAETYEDASTYFFIGPDHYPVALESALNVKEISYKYVEGFAAGELKHGPLALVTEDTPVFAIVTGDGEFARKTIDHVKEVEARNAPVVAVAHGASDMKQYATFSNCSRRTYGQRA